MITVLLLAAGLANFWFGRAWLGVFFIILAVWSFSLDHSKRRKGGPWDD